MTLTDTPAAPEVLDADADGDSPGAHRRRRYARLDWWAGISAFVIIPLIAVAVAAGDGYLSWQDHSARDAQRAQIDSVQAARDSATALLSYEPDTAAGQLGAAAELLTGDFRNSYTQLTRDVVIPAARQKRISAVASVSAAASVSATARHAVVLVFVNQTVIVGDRAPAVTTSTVLVTMDKVHRRWLVSGFDPT